MQDVCSTTQDRLFIACPFLRSFPGSQQSIINTVALGMIDQKTIMSLDDTPQAAFVTMIVDRLQTLELLYDDLKRDNEFCQKKIAELSDEVNHRCPRLYLTAHSKFTVFNDGYGLSYEVLKEPKMIDNRFQKEGRGDDDFVPLDDDHWNAFVLPNSVWLQVGSSRLGETCNRIIKVGRPDEPLTLRTFITEIHRKLLEPNDAGQTLADDIEYTNATGSESNGESFHGYYEGLAPSCTSSYANDMELLLTY